jgi:hypothetical protein
MNVRAAGHDLTPFLEFALKGVQSQCRRLLSEIRVHLAKALFRNTRADLFGRLRSPRKRVMSGRHIELLRILLDSDELSLSEVVDRSRHLYSVRNAQKAQIRDLNYLARLGALRVRRVEEPLLIRLSATLAWPAEITGTEFFRLIKTMPKGRIHGFLSS